MAVSNLDDEPYEISARFYRALQEEAMSLEADAKKDEAFAASLSHPEHVRRQNRLVRAQRERARDLRNFLAKAEIRIG
jgi:fructose-bisphosphate aldolase class 1